MTDKRYSSKKYSDYPVIVDNKDNTELTLDSVVKILNEQEWDKLSSIEEHNRIHRDIREIGEQKMEIEAKYDKLWYIIILLALIVIIETIHIIGLC